MNFEWIDRACPLCGGTKEAFVFAESNIDGNKLTEFAFASRKLPEYMHPRLVECHDCGLLYANPAVSPNTLSALYHEAAFDSSEESGVASRTYERIVQSYIGELPDRRSAIDIGAGDGAFCERLVELGFASVTGVEPSAAPVAAAKPGVRELLANRIFRASDFSPNSMSLITCFQVMEHFSDPLGIASAAFSILKPKGLFLAVAHNQRSLSAIMLGTKSPIYDIEHLQLFTKKTGRKLLESAGYVRIKVFPVWNRYPLNYWMRLFPIPFEMKAPLLSVLKKTGLGNIQISLPAGNVALVGFKP